MLYPAISIEHKGIPNLLLHYPNFTGLSVIEAILAILQYLFMHPLERIHMNSVIWIILIITSMIGMFLVHNPSPANASSCSQKAEINGAQEQQSVSSEESFSI